MCPALINEIKNIRDDLKAFNPKFDKFVNDALEVLQNKTLTRDELCSTLRLSLNEVLQREFEIPYHLIENGNALIRCIVDNDCPRSCSDKEAQLAVDKVSSSCENNDFDQHQLNLRANYGSLQCVFALANFFFCSSSSYAI